LAVHLIRKTADTINIFAKMKYLKRRTIMDYRNTLALGFVLLSGSVFVQSLSSANAFPSGPNVSLGSNPIQSWAGRSYNSLGWVTLATVQQDFIITDLIVSGTGQWCTTTLSTQNVDASTDVLFSGSFKAYNQSYGQGNSQFNGNLRSGAKVNAGSTIYANIEADGQCSYIVSGYYSH